MKFFRLKSLIIELNLEVLNRRLLLIRIGGPEELIVRRLFASIPCDLIQNGQVLGTVLRVEIVQRLCKNKRPIVPSYRLHHQPYC